MLVKDLMEKLSQFDPECKVSINNSEVGSVQCCHWCAGSDIDYERRAKEGITPSLAPGQIGPMSKIFIASITSSLERVKP